MRGLALTRYDRPGLHLPSRNPAAGANTTDASTANTSTTSASTADIATANTSACPRARPRPQLTALPGVRHLAEPRGPLPGVRCRRGSQLKRVSRPGGGAAPAIGDDGTSGSASGSARRSAPV
jgi:hypothetical protein